jgi:endonuclease/exonuclease/phosphatase family metal-dependent hydrolase
MSLNQKIRLLTLNIAHGRGMMPYQGMLSAQKILHNLKKIAEMLNTMKVDIVALQEVDVDSHWNRHIDFVSILKEQTGFIHSLMGVHNQRLHARRSLAYGNALLSRYPINDIHVESFGQKTIGEKGFVSASIQTHLGTLPIINVHLNPRSKKLRIIQIEQLLEYLQTKPTPFIICGDFNCGPHKKGDASTHLLNFLQKNTPYTVWPHTTGTFPAHLPKMFSKRIIDLVFVPDSLKVVCCDVLNTRVSDHRPVFVEIEAAMNKKEPQRN